MNGTLTMAEIQAKVSGSSFYAGMRVLPKASREAMFAIYAFCRMVDDIADDQSRDRAYERRNWPVGRQTSMPCLPERTPGVRLF